MKTIPVSLIVAGVLAPAISFAQPDPGAGAQPGREGGGRHGPPRPFGDFWKSIDKDHDGFISLEEFASMPRVQNLPEEKRAGLFKRLDKDADGKLGREELGRIGKHRDGQGLQRLWELDADKSGGVSFEEFKAGRIFSKLAPERQEQIFKRLDTDHDGIITPKDKPEPPFHHDGERTEPRQMLRLLDTDHDGALSFAEFRLGPMVKDLTEDEQEDRFEALDRNHDQKLSEEDFPPRGEPKPGGNPPSAEQ